ncbi:hemerythrin domain-containing protein [Piscinibacter sakaiensis]|uniref:hemerythrin domain-containing protein n=1 Tax=Piscinibacter sakaiensis TaxID=1547922 RepID=UPI003AADD622
MSTVETSTESSPSDNQPLDEFSHCHAGILAQLESFRGLPDLLDPAARARRIATRTMGFFDDVVRAHHADEERELFPAVLASARKGAEREMVQGTVDRLTAEHRQIEAMWSRLSPALKDVAKGRDSDLDASSVQRLVDTYVAHARFEEQMFLPLAQAILGRNSNHMAALGLSLHMRHADPAVISRAMAHW